MQACDTPQYRSHISHKDKYVTPHTVCKYTGTCNAAVNDKVMTADLDSERPELAAAMYLDKVLCCSRFAVV